MPFYKTKIVSHHSGAATGKAATHDVFDAVFFVRRCLLDIESSLDDRSLDNTGNDSALDHSAVLYDSTLDDHCEEASDTILPGMS
jgi:hypothetical protein